MGPFSQLRLDGIDLPDDLSYYSEYWVSDELGLLSEVINIHFIPATMFYDFFCGSLWYDVELRLDLCKSSFELQVVRCTCLVRPYRIDCLGGKDIPEDLRINDCRHDDNGGR